ncbi:MAG: DJ-1/PfpI family protein [Campylobacteraceae bacterium]
MSKKVALLVPNPVNGYGLFSYLEAFYEAGVKYTTFAINPNNKVKTNSGYELSLDKNIKDLVGKENEFDGVVFACGDAIISLGELLPTKEWQDTLKVLKNFEKLNKKIAGHCAAALIFQIAEIGEGKKMAVHPLGKSKLEKIKAVDNSSIVDGNFFTAKCEDHTKEFISWFIKFL